MAAAEALMELVPSKGNNRAEPEDEKEKERVMAATYAAYTKRAKLQAEKTKAQQLSRQLKTRLQFARLKVDYGWTRQSLNEVENLYFHLSRARPTHPQQQRAETTTPPIPDPSTPPTVVATPAESQEQESQEPPSQSTQPTKIESCPDPSSQTTPPAPARPLSQSSSLPLTTPVTPAQPPKRTPFVERTRTGGIVRTSQPVERLRTGGKVRSSPVGGGGPSPKKRGRPRIPDVTAEPTAVENGSGDGGGLTYDSFWSSLGTMKSGSA